MSSQAARRMPLAILAVVIGMISLQSGASLAKQLFPVIGPAGGTALRLFFASAVLVAIWRPWRRWPSRGEWRALALYGLSLGCMNLLFYQAIARIPLGIAVALEFTGPLLVAVVSSRQQRDLVWVALAIVGVVLLLPIAPVSGRLDPLGIALALAAGGCWAAYIIFGQRAGGAIHGGTATTLGMCVAALVTVPYGAIVTGSSLLDWHLWPLGLGVGVLSSALPYSLEMVAMQAIPMRTFGILMSVEPAIAALSGLLFLGERLSPQQWLAIAAVIAASAGSTSSAREPEAQVS